MNFDIDNDNRDYAIGQEYTQAWTALLLGISISRIQNLVELGKDRLMPSSPFQNMSDSKLLQLAQVSNALKILLPGTFILPPTNSFDFLYEAWKIGNGSSIGYQEMCCILDFGGL